MTFLRNFAPLILPVTLLATPSLSPDRVELSLEVRGGREPARELLLSPAMVTAEGTIDVTNLSTRIDQNIATTDGSASVYQATLTEQPIPGSVMVSDGVYTWSQSNGSDAPDEFSVSFSDTTRNLFVIYSDSVPEEGRKLVVSYRVHFELVTEGMPFIIDEHFATTDGSSFVYQGAIKHEAIPGSVSNGTALSAISG